MQSQSQTTAPEQQASRSEDGPDTVTRHNGDPIQSDVDFFAPPPPEIGNLLTAESTLKKGKKPMEAMVRWPLIVASAGAIMVAVHSLWQPNQAASAVGSLTTWDVVVYYTIVVAAGAFVGWCVHYFTRFTPVCSYTGHLGVARCTLQGSRDGPLKWNVLPFEFASTLKRGTTEKYHNGVYTGTTYRFIWRSTDNQVLLKLNGSFSAKNGAPKAHDAFWFASAAEVAWTMFAYQRVKQQYKANGYVEFVLDSSDAIRVHEDALEFVHRGTSTWIRNDEIKEMSIHAGQVRIVHKDARWFSNKGKHQFKYENLPNAKLLLHTFGVLLGRHFE